MQNGSEGTIFEIVYRRLVARLGYKQTIWAIAHRLCHLICVILHRGVPYEERGPARCMQDQNNVGLIE